LPFLFEVVTMNGDVSESKSTASQSSGGKNSLMMAWEKNQKYDCKN